MSAAALEGRERVSTTSTPSSYTTTAALQLIGVRGFAIAAYTPPATFERSKSSWPRAAAEEARMAVEQRRRARFIFALRFGWGRRCRTRILSGMQASAEVDGLREPSGSPRSP